MAIRSIEIQKYKFTLEENKSYSSNWQTEIVGRINNIYSAIVQISNFGDPVPTIVCELNDNNMAVIQNAYLFSVKTSEFIKTKTNFTINNVQYDTENRTITFTGEVTFNEARNGVDVEQAIRNYGKGLFEHLPLPSNIFRLNNRESYPDYWLNSETISPNYGEYLQLQTYGKNNLEVMGGTVGSLKDLFGGEFDKSLSTTVALQRKALGRANETRVLSTSVHVKGIKYTIDTSNILNGAVHIFSYKPEGLPEDAPNVIIYIKDVPVGTYPSEIASQLTSRIAPTEYRTGSVIIKDWSSEGQALGDPSKDSIATIRANLIKQANAWNSANKSRGLPVETIEFDFQHIRQQDISQNNSLYDIMALQLGDKVQIKVKELNRIVSGRISGYTYNIMSDTYDNVIVGSSLQTIIDKIN